MKSIILFALLIVSSFITNASVLLNSNSTVYFSTTNDDFLESLKPKSEEVITVENNLYKRFVESFRLFEVNPGMTVIEADLKIISLTNENIKVLQIPIIIEGSSINFVMGVYNEEKSEFLIFYEEHSTLENGAVNAKVFDEDKKLLYRTLVTQDGFDITTEESNARPFKACMDAQEEHFESTFTGWLYWNYVPATQLSAAINCKGCEAGWWSNAGC